MLQTISQISAKDRTHKAGMKAVAIAQAINVETVRFDATKTKAFNGRINFYGNSN